MKFIYENKAGVCQEVFDKACLEAVEQFALSLINQGTDVADVLYRGADHYEALCGVDLDAFFTLNEDSNILITIEEV